MTEIGRRQALRTLAVGGLGTAAAPLWFERLTAVAQAHAQAPSRDPDQAAAATQATVPVPWTPKVLSAHQDDLVSTLTEMIIPQTDTPGARAALVNRFIDAVLEDADEADHKAFLKGLDWIDRRSEELFGGSFFQATPEQQAALLTTISSGKNKVLADQIGVEFFQAIKAMTIIGYYTSEVGMREELKDDGNLFFAASKGCVHPEHGAAASAPARPSRKR
jgi:hypothetical protein